MDSFIHFDAVSKSFGTMKVVDGLDFHVGRGEFVSLLGPSGSGKTTLLMMLAGFETPTSGAIHVDGVRVERLPPYKRNMGVVFQSYSNAAVNGSQEVGGLVDRNEPGSVIARSYATGAVAGGNFTGGLAAINNGKIIGSYATGSVNGGNFAGGLVGIDDSGGFGATISNSYATGRVTGTLHVGGFAGVNCLSVQ